MDLQLCYCGFASKVHHRPLGCESETGLQHSLRRTVCSLAKVRGFRQRLQCFPNCAIATGLSITARS
jgi:hypothetical protein